MDELLKTLINTIKHIFAEADFDLDAGDVKVLGNGPNGILLALYARDEEGNTTEAEIGRVLVAAVPL